jgi:hypothetical protein
MAGDQRTQSPKSAIAAPWRKKSFARVEAQARKVLRERGLSDTQIEVELHRAKRKEEG